MYRIANIIRISIIFVNGKRRFTHLCIECYGVIIHPKIHPKTTICDRGLDIHLPGKRDLSPFLNNTQPQDPSKDHYLRSRSGYSPTGFTWREGSYTRTFSRFLNNTQPQDESKDHYLRSRFGYSPTGVTWREGS